MRLLELLRIFLALRGEMVDIKKAPVVYFFGRDPPVRQAIGLGLDQLGQRLEAGGLARGAIVRGDVLVDEQRDIGVAPAQRGEAVYVQIFVEPALDQLVAVDLRARRQIAEGGDQTLELAQLGVRGAEALRQALAAIAEDLGILLGIDREAV